jgi:hypothetical protein
VPAKNQLHLWKVALGYQATACYDRAEVIAESTLVEKVRDIARPHTEASGHFGDRQVLRQGILLWNEVGGHHHDGLHPECATFRVVIDDIRRRQGDIRRRRPQAIPQN